MFYVVLFFYDFDENGHQLQSRNTPTYFTVEECEKGIQDNFRLWKKYYPNLKTCECEPGISILIDGLEYDKKIGIVPGKVLKQI